MNPLIFVDMDGVLVNLKKGLSHLIGKDLTGLSMEEWNKYFYTFSEKMSDEELTNFYSSLPPTDEYKQIWSAVSDYRPFVLTSISKREPVIKGKERWCMEHLGLSSDRVYCTLSSSDKVGYACKNSLLIDDFDRNINQWRSAGGSAIHHTNIISTLEEINIYLRKI